MFINLLYQNQYDFVEVKTFEVGKKHPPGTICIFGTRQQDILNGTTTYALINFWPKMNNGPNWYIC